MAIPRNHPKAFKPGNRASPGRPPLPPVRHVGTKTELVTKYETFTVQQLDAAIDTPEKVAALTVRELMIIRAMKRAVDGGQDLDRVWDRTEGKVGDKISVTGSISREDSPLEGLKASEIRQLAQLEKLRQERLKGRETNEQ